MSRIYENAKINFSSFDEFKEVAVKTLNEIFGREKPLDVIDFSYDESNYKAIGYYDGERIPAEQPVGTPLTEDVSEELRLKAKFAANEAVTFEELVVAKQLGIDLPAEIVSQLVEAVKRGAMSFEAAHAAGLATIDGVPVLEAAANAIKAGELVAEENAAAATAEVKELPYGVKSVGDKVISDKALELAIEAGVDIEKIEGTGRDGTIKKSDVADYIANNAPAKENADGSSNEQSNA